MIKSVTYDNWLSIMGRNKFGTELLPMLDAYDMVGWFRRAIDIRSNSVASIPYDIYADDQVVFSDVPTNAPPNDLSVAHLFSGAVRDLDLFGAAYLFYDEDTERWERLSPATIRPRFSPYGEGLLGFQRLVNGQSYELAPNDLIYLWVKDPTLEAGPGKGFAYSALPAATVLYYIQRFQSTFFEQGALNPTILTVEGYNMMPTDDRKRLSDQLRSMMQGIRNAFSLVPVSAKTSAVNLMQPLDQMGMSNMVLTQRETINTALGVPQSLSLSNAANYATAVQDNFSFYDTTVVPLARLIEQQLNEQLYSLRGYRFQFQPSRLEVYQQVEYLKAEKLGAMLDRGVITVDEFRAAIGYPPYPKPTQETV